MVAASPIMATAPSGKGLVMIPTIVPRKMARRCHAFSVTPDGGGMSHTMAASATDIPRFFMSAPHLNSDDGADAAATTGRLLAWHCGHVALRDVCLRGAEYCKLCLLPRCTARPAAFGTECRVFLAKAEVVEAFKHGNEGKET